MVIAPGSLSGKPHRHLIGHFLSPTTVGFWKSGSLSDFEGGGVMVKSRYIWCLWRLSFRISQYLLLIGAGTIGSAHLFLIDRTIDLRPSALVALFDFALFPIIPFLSLSPFSLSFFSTFFSLFLSLHLFTPFFSVFVGIFFYGCDSFLLSSQSQSSLFIIIILL